MPPTNYTKGIVAEYYALLYLQIRGHRLIYHRFRCPAGEIDLITTKAKTIYFTEVKLRHDRSLVSGMESVSARQIARIYRSSQYFNNNHEQYAGYDQQIMAAIITARSSNQPFWPLSWPYWPIVIIELEWTNLPCQNT